MILWKISNRKWIHHIPGKSHFENQFHILQKNLISKMKSQFEFKNLISKSHLENQIEISIRFYDCW